MPNQIFILNIAGIAFQYALVLLLYLFLFRVIKVIYHDLIKPETITEKEPKRKQEKFRPDAKLIVLDSGPMELSFQSVTLGKNLLIGRSPENDIAINDTYLSNEHACIARYKQGYILTDLQSTNGTFLNGNRVTEDVTLQHGDVIKIGAITLKFER